MTFSLKLALIPGRNAVAKMTLISIIKKHGISFEDAKQALNCGLVVAYPEEETTRIISARKANKKERKFYEAQL